MSIIVSPGKPAKIARDPAVWTAEFTDPAVLKAERERFGRRAWTMLGLTRDLAAHGDWIRADLWGRSVFVQRFHDKLAGFENVCAHRFFPLRTEDKGNGPLRCGLHGWMYDAKGKVIGAPLCEELFGKKQGALDRHLKSIEVDICGGLVFGRLPPEPGDETPRPSLADYLGPFHAPVEKITGSFDPMGDIERTVAANWKICYHLTLEDYHIGIAHPGTFSANGYLPPGVFRYFRGDPHSAMIVDKTRIYDEIFADFRESCARDRMAKPSYIIMQIFPNLLLFMTWNGIAGVGLYTPTAPDTTFYRINYAQILEPDVELFTAEVKEGIMKYSTTLAEEDQLSAERLQQTAHQTWMEPMLGGQEERIAWFDETYAKFMAG
ncbi:MAG: SRPBCC family protein [Alphaproteobacteria bacterium]